MFLIYLYKIKNVLIISIQFEDNIILHSKTKEYKQNYIYLYIYISIYLSIVVNTFNLLIIFFFIFTKKKY